MRAVRKVEVVVMEGAVGVAVREGEVEHDIVFVYDDFRYPSMSFCEFLYVNGRLYLDVANQCGVYNHG